MKYLVTKIQLKNITKEQFHHIVKELHHIEDSYHPYITNTQYGWIIDYQDILAYHIEDEWIYEYIYNEAQHMLYINLDNQGYSDYVDMIQYLIDHNHINQNDLLYVDNKAFLLDSYENFKDYNYNLPVIYLQHTLSKNTLFVEKLIQKVKGMAYIIYGNKDFEKEMMNHFHFRNQSYLLFFNNEYLKLTSFKGESEEDFIERIFIKVQKYTTKRVFAYPYSVNELYKTVLREMISSESENEDTIANRLEERIMSLEEERDVIKEKIEKLNSSIEILQWQNNQYSSSLDKMDGYPLIYRGDEKEYYSGEQKDMVLYLLERSKASLDDKELTIVEQVLKDNPKVGTRDELIGEIERILKSMKGMTDRTIAQLGKCGISLDHNDHFAARFYTDTRYLITVASSTSDVQFPNQLRRHIKKFFF